jgi:hypothetical protein
MDAPGEGVAGLEQESGDAPLCASEEVQLTFTVRNRAEAEKLLVKLKKSLEH